ncbi:type II toxin-antitoxin system VapC family toxin [Synechococcus sp. C9]|jgi:PIN domain nuclease of toxin-antitoxin system|uniref:PIN domain-containing protein n=1 Tax=Synechococcus sp. C9 TaxID=102119 RepID=UPI001FF5175F|nr:type II toxin-antitoxin system VapC family toxin [Synechococcus sp. C9]
MSRVVLDASAVLVLLNQEAGSDGIAPLIPQSVISAVNLSEVIAKLADAGIPEASIHQILKHLNLEVIAFNDQQALTTGLLRPLTKSQGLSLGDRACLALGMSLNLPVITSDQTWSRLSLAIEIRVIR